MNYLTSKSQSHSVLLGTFFRRSTMDNKDLENLIQGVKRGDRKSAEAIIKHFQEGLLRFNYLLTKNLPLAQDICQESFIKALDKIHQLKDSSHFKPWLYKIARNLFHDYVKSPGNNQSSLNNIQIDTNLVYSENIEQISYIADTLSMLNEDEQLILLLVDLEEYTYKETAKILEISEDSVRSRLHRAKLHFLEKYGNDSPLSIVLSVDDPKGHKT